MKTVAIGFIGAGNMAEAIIKGLLNSKESYNIRAVDSNAERLEKMVHEYKIVASTLKEAVENSEVILLAVKPKDIVELLEGFKDINMSGKLLMSVAAGIPLAVYERTLPEAAVIRCMPNTSSAVLQSMTGLAKGKLVNDHQAHIGEKIFSQIGKTLWLDEKQMNTVTAISGSGPAYFYYFTECLIEAGVKLGLSSKDAEILAVETLIGAGKMISQSQKTPSELREAVTSPNGTTYAALMSFKESNLDDIVLRAADAARKRGYEMEGEYSK